MPILRTEVEAYRFREKVAIESFPPDANGEADVGLEITDMLNKAIKASALLSRTESETIAVALIQSTPATPESCRIVLAVERWLNTAHPEAGSIDNQRRVEIAMALIRSTVPR